MELTPEGLVIDTVDEIVADISATLKNEISPNLDTNPETSVLGQIIGILAERERHNQEVLRELYQSNNPGGASGQALTQLALITGTVREDATHSTVTATLTLNAGVTVPAGSRANVAGAADVQFETLADVENTGGSPDDFDVEMRAIETGPVRANAGTLTEITTPVVGWTAVTNALDAALGREDEDDPELRTRRDAELRIQGSSAVDAIAADVLDVDGVVSVTKRENTTDATDANGLPAHSFQIVVWDGVGVDASDDAVAQAIWDAKPAGILSYGGPSPASGVAVDRQGDSHTLDFARATQIELYVEVDVEIDADVFPVNGDDLIKTAVVSVAAERWTVGADAVPSALISAVFTVPGVVAVPAIRIDDTSPVVPTGTYDVNFNQIAIADTARVDVTHV